MVPIYPTTKLEPEKPRIISSEKKKKTKIDKHDFKASSYIQDGDDINIKGKILLNFNRPLNDEDPKIDIREQEAELLNR